MQALPQGSVDLVFADPPFNIGYSYDVYDDKVEHQQYIDWCGRWIESAYNVLKPDGSFWLAIGDEYAAELKLESQKVGFHCRSWVVWYYTFGVNCANKFTRSHAHLFYFVKDKNSFTFRDEDLDNRVPSARELVYNDKRANPIGRLPDDTWIIKPADVSDDDTFVLRPQEIPESFDASEDTWYIPRVAGTFKERAGFHGCQMPEQLLGRIIRTCSNEGDLVLDPFSGSATTLAVAKKLGRQQIGFDLSQEYVAHGRDRLESIKIGDRLNGGPEPSKAARNDLVENGLAKKSRSKAAIDTDEKKKQQLHEQRFAESQRRLSESGIVEAFRLAHEGYSSDRVVVDPDLNAAFADNCRKLGVAGNITFWNSTLFRLRKAGNASQLKQIETTQRTSFSWLEIDPYRFACEIAYQKIISDGQASSLDEIICCPELANSFDEIARKFAPGFSSLEYRWAALKIRKQARVARTRAASLNAKLRFPNAKLIQKIDPSTAPQTQGLYLISGSRTRTLYAGETFDLCSQIASLKENVEAWSSITGTALIQYLPSDIQDAGNLTWQSYLISKKKAKLNCQELLIR